KQCDPSTAPCLQPAPALSRNQSQVIVAGRRSIEALDDRPRPAIYRRFGVIRRRRCDHECIAAVPDLWVGGTGNSLIAARPARDIAPRDKTRQTGGVIPWQLAVAARAKLGFLRARLLRRRVMERSGTGGQDGGRRGSERWP